MNASIDQLRFWMAGKENEHLEFKEAKSGYDTDKLAQYCCALANECGGHIILGVTDKLPRRIVGTNAFMNLEDIKSKLIQRLQIRIDVEEMQTDGGRVLIFTVPSRPIGVPIQYNKIYWMRRGEELVAMTPDMLKRIFNEEVPPLSSTKSFTGHTLAAAGGIEAVLAVLSIQNGWVYPNLNFSNKIEETGLVPVTQLLSNKKVNHILSNSFGFGGNNSSLLISAC